MNVTYYIEVFDYYPWIYGKTNSFEEAKKMLASCIAKGMQAAITQL